jgi:mono/diheme cytochrome c family protein
MPPNPTVAAQPISLPQSAPDLALGAQVYADNCTRCHGVTGRGDGEMANSGQVTGVPDFTDPLVSQAAAPMDWFEIVTNGRLDKLMPPWGAKLTDAQRWAVTMYVYTLADRPERVSQGQVAWTARCAECHGEAGEGTPKGAPLPNLLETSTNDLLKTLADGIPDKMPSFANDLSPDERAAAIAYARTLSLANATAPLEAASAPTAAVGNANPRPATTESAATTETASAATATGVVTGKVVNRTAGGKVPADLTLNLHVISDPNSTSPGDILNTTVNRDGTYRFDNVPLQTGWQYVVTTSYKDAPFNSEVVEGDPTHPQLELPLDIYEVADDAASIQIDGILTMVQANTQAGELQVVQIVNFTNASDHVYLKQANGTSSSVSVRLPKGAVFQDFSGGTYLLSADGTQVLDTQPVLPGNSHVMHLAFTLPYSGSISIDQPVDFKLDGQVEVMVASGGMSVTGDGFAGLGTRQLGDSTYESYGGNLSRAAGASLHYNVSGTDAVQQTGAVATTNGVSPFAYVLIGGGLLAIGAAFGFFVRERTGARSSLSPDINTLMKQIADLDIGFDNGKLAEAAYRQQRAALKAQLVTLMKDKASTESPTQSGGEEEGARK